MNHQIIFTMLWFHSLVAFFPLAIILLYKWPHLWHSLLTLFLGVLTAIIDLGTDEVQLSALLLLVFGLFLGFNQPKSALQSVFMLGGWIPVVELARIFLVKESGNLFTERFGSLLAFIPAFIGIYVGVWLRTTVVRKQKLSSQTMP